MEDLVTTALVAKADMEGLVTITLVDRVVAMEDLATTTVLAGRVEDMEDPVTTTQVDRVAAMEDPVITALVDRVEGMEDLIRLEASLVDNPVVDPAVWSLGLSRRECKLLRDMPRRKVGKYHCCLGSPPSLGKLLLFLSLAGR
jgi:hypothetical protein